MVLPRDTPRLLNQGFRDRTIDGHVLRQYAFGYAPVRVCYCCPPPPLLPHLPALSSPDESFPRLRCYEYPIPTDPNVDPPEYNINCGTDAATDDHAGNPIAPRTYNANTEYTDLPCRPVVKWQPCAWNEAYLRGHDIMGQLVETLPSKLEEDYPFPCSPGVLGGNETADQVSSLCAGLCPAGYFCNDKPTVTEKPCPPGSYCEPRQ